MLNTGLIGEHKIIVDNENTARAMGSGSLEVFATPALVAVMEKASTNCISEYLENGQSSVGTKVEIEHISPTPIGMSITATSTLEKIEGRKLVFSVIAKDDVGIVGKGMHERVIISNDKFMLKTVGKKEER